MTIILASLSSLTYTPLTLHENYNLLTTEHSVFDTFSRNAGFQHHPVKLHGDCAGGCAKNFSSQDKNCSIGIGGRSF